MKRARDVLLGTAISSAIVVGLYFSGIFDATPQISIDTSDMIIFTDKRPSIDDENIMLCIPAAYSGEEGIIGHYSTGNGRQGKSDFRYTTITLDCKTHFTLSDFANQLVDYERAWNLDMGTYSYGWYRDKNGKLYQLGLSTYWNNNKQTNWIVVYKK